MKRVLSGITSVLLCVGIAVASPKGTSICKQPFKKFKNVIIMIPDGCGVGHFTLARWYKAKPLACDALNVAIVRTYGANTYITDSAPAATAFATGYKSWDKYISVLPAAGTMPGVEIPENKANGPVATVLEAVKLSGRATGLVATSTITHATPGAYAGHWYARGDEALLQKQMVYQNVDVVLGGGRKNILTPANGGTRKDNENLLDTLIMKGYSIVNDRYQLEAVNPDCQKLWGQFSMNAMGRDWDRSLDAWKDEPSLADMTRKAIEVLKYSTKGQQRGFFLMVEGSQVDWASHANEPAGVLSEYLAFDAAVEAALEFAKMDHNTLVLVLSDHDNGGLSLGSRKTDANYSSRSLDSLISPVLKSAKITGVGIESLLGANRSDPGSIRNILSTWWGINDLTDDEVGTIAVSGTGSMEYALGPILSSRTDMSWTTTGHTGNDVPLYYYGTDVPFKTIENTDVASICEKAMGVDLDVAHDLLFRKADVLFNGATLKIDTIGVRNGAGYLTVELDNKTAKLPFNKNVIIVNGKSYTMNGITVYSYNNHSVYVPFQAKCILSGIPARNCLCKK
jgi:alkaline phosphatase